LVQFCDDLAALTLPKWTTAWDVSTVYFKIRLLPSVRFCDKLAAYHAAEMDSHHILNVRLVAEIVANNEELHLLASDFDIGFL
jgi:hypothetical protein